MVRIFGLVLLLVCISDVSNAQNPAFSVNQNLNNFINTTKVAETSGYGQSGRIYARSYLYSDQNLGASYGGTTNSGYDLHNPAHSYSPKLSYIYTYFEGRRLNGYYRDLESWRKAERIKLKREGSWNRESIEYLYSP